MSAAGAWLVLVPLFSAEGGPIHEGCISGGKPVPMNAIGAFLRHRLMSSRTDCLVFPSFTAS